MKKSYLIAGFVTAAIITAGSVGYAAATKDTCNYDPASGNYHNNGKVYAYGSWDDAVACAKEGILPQVVADRLGAWGDKKTQVEGRNHAKINDEVKKAKEAAAKAKADQNK